MKNLNTIKKPRIICKYRRILWSTTKERKGDRNYVQIGDRLLNTNHKPLLNYAN